MPNPKQIQTCRGEPPNPHHATGGEGGEPPKPTPEPHHTTGRGGSNPQPHHTTPQGGEGSNPPPHHTGGGGWGGTIGGGEGGGGGGGGEGVGGDGRTGIIYMYISFAALGSRRSLNPFKQECTDRLQRGPELRSQS